MFFKTVQADLGYQLSLMPHEVSVFRFLGGVNYSECYLLTSESHIRSMKESVKAGLRPGWLRSRVGLGAQPPLGWINGVVRERCAG